MKGEVENSNGDANHAIRVASSSSTIRPQAQGHGEALRENWYCPPLQFLSHGPSTPTWVLLLVATLGPSLGPFCSIVFTLLDTSLGSGDHLRILQSNVHPNKVVNILEQVRLRHTSYRPVHLLSSLTPPKSYNVVYLQYCENWAVRLFPMWPQRMSVVSSMMWA